MGGKVGGRYPLEPLPNVVTGPFCGRPWAMQDWACRPSSPKVPPRLIAHRRFRRLNWEFSGSLKHMQRKVIISCAVTGSADTPAKNPAVPVTPQQIAASSIDAAKAGATVVHIHVRDPQTSKPSMDGALYREVVEQIGRAHV